MDWPSVAQYAELCLGFVLAVKLLSLRLHRVYSYFSLLLFLDISGTLVWAIAKKAAGTPFQFDYRPFFLLGSLLIWTFTLLTVYALLDAILAHLPGILRLSRRVLNWSFIGAVVFGIFTALPEFRTAQSGGVFIGRLAHLTAIAMVLERVIDSVALLVLVCILVFLLLFPVEMSKNLAAFFSGFVIYFALKACFAFALTTGADQSIEYVRFVNLLNAVLTGCVFTYWAISITRAGETVPAKLRIAVWPKRQEQVMIAQLEAMNTSLLRAARR